MRRLELRFDIRQAGMTLLLAYGVLALLNAGFFLLLTRPKVFEHRTMTEKTVPLRTALEEREAQVTDLETYLAALNQAQEDLVRLRQDILATKNSRLVPVQIELERIAGQFQINVNQATTENEALPEEGLERFAMVVPLEGGYQNLRSFVQAVEASDQFLVIEKVALARGQEGGVILELNITVATYFDAPDLRQERGGENPRART